jgi:hypothetical protein
VLLRLNSPDKRRVRALVVAQAALTLKGVKADVVLWGP